MFALILLLTGLALLTPLALRFGYDSRDTFRSAEHEQARLGVRRDGATADDPLPAPHAT